MKKIKKMKFKYNFNNKLHCDYFTTFRRRGDYEMGEIVEITCEDGGIRGLAEIISARFFSFELIKDEEAYIDSGTGADNLRSLLYNFLCSNFDKKTENEDPMIDKLLLKWVKKEEGPRDE